MNAANASARRAGRERSQRQLRVGELLRHALVEILARDELHDPALAGVSVTVTEIRVSPDLQNATVYVMPLGGEGVPAVVAALNHAGPFLRRLLGAQVTLRRLPSLRFVSDETFDEGARVDRLLRSPAVRRDTAPRADEGPDGA